MSALIDSYLDLLKPLGQVSVSRMFGGHGFYREGVMFALEAFNRLFIKADAESKPRFIAAGCEPFAYTYRDGREITMSYFEPPEAAFANPQRMKPWALLGIEAAIRSAKPKKPGLAKKKARVGKRSRPSGKGRVSQ